MIEVTATALRKDLFNILDRIEKTGETLRVSRRGRAVDLHPSAVQKSVAEMTPEERFDRWMAKGPLPGFETVPDDIDTNKSHWTWDPETKFRDLRSIWIPRWSCGSQANVTISCPPKPGVKSPECAA